MIEWNTIGAVTTFSSALSVLLGIVVLQAAPQRAQNRSLALLLVLEAAAGFGGGGLLYLTTEPSVAYASQVLGFTVGAAVLFAYLLFLGTLPGRLARPLALPMVRRVLVALLVLVPFVVLFWPRAFVVGVAPAPYSAWEGVIGPAAPSIFLATLPVTLWGLAVALGMWLRAPRGSMQRRKGRLYAIAFAIRDAGYVAFIVLLLTANRLGVSPTFAIYLIATTALAFVLLLTYGILNEQVLDIDLRLKWGVQRGTLAGMILATFFAVSQLVENVASDRLGLFLGSIAAGFLLFLIQPLMRFAERVSDRAMPHVHDTEEYRLVRKREVYQAAVETALENGAISERERGVLATLASQLALDPKEAFDLERAALGRPL